MYGTFHGCVFDCFLLCCVCWNTQIFRRNQDGRGGTEVIVALFELMEAQKNKLLKDVLKASHINVSDRA